MKNIIKILITIVFSAFILISSLYISNGKVTENEFATKYYTPAETRNPNPDFEQIVYVTHSGKKYHKRSCEFILGHSIKSYKKSQAEELGFEPCYKCMRE